MIQFLNNYKFYIDPNHVLGPFEDWSKVRSHSRARRRLKAGHKQRIRVYYEPNPNAVVFGDSILIHPTMYYKIKNKMEVDHDNV